MLAYRIVYVLLCAVASVTAAPLCNGNAWEGATQFELEHGLKLPEIQCWRKPVCVRHSYLTRARCEARPLDTDWAETEAEVQHAKNLSMSLHSLASRFLVNRTVLFTGDSVTEALWDFMLCDAAREGLKPTIVTESHHRFLPAALADKATAFYQSIRTKFWDFSGLGGNWPSRVVFLPETQTLLAYKKSSGYVPIDQISQLEVADVLIINHGHHYLSQEFEDRQIYTKHMREMFRQLQRTASTPGKAVLFRETSAQHFSTTGAFAGWQQAHPAKNSTCRCSPLLPEFEDQNNVKWQNLAVRRARAEAGAMNTFILPFYNFTAARPYGHEEAYCSFGKRHSSKSCCDCTHMCYAPSLSRVFTESIYKGLEFSEF